MFSAIIAVTKLIGGVEMIIKILDKETVGEDISSEPLRRFGTVIEYLNTDSSQLLERARDADVLVVNKIKIGKEALDAAGNLKLICVFATGFDNIDVRAARERGVAVCNVPAYSTDSVLLFTMAKVFALASHLNEFSHYVESGEYSASGAANKLTPVYHELRNKTWGIVGYGNIGRAVAKVAEALGARVVVNRRTASEGEQFVDLDTLCRESDVITVHCPLNDESRNMINKDRISLMKSGVILVNEARGAVLDEAAVAEAVANGKIGAFGCDVYSAEPFPKEHPYSKIMKLPNVILTPHCAWGAYEARERCMSVILENIQSFIDGKNKNRVDI